MGEVNLEMFMIMFFLVLDNNHDEYGMIAVNAGVVIVITMYAVFIKDKDM